MKNKFAFFAVMLGLMLAPTFAIAAGPHGGFWGGYRGGYAGGGYGAYRGGYRGYDHGGGYRGRSNFSLSLGFGGFFGSDYGYDRVVYRDDYCPPPIYSSNYYYQPAPVVVAPTYVAPVYAAPTYVAPTYVEPAYVPAPVVYESPRYYYRDSCYVAPRPRFGTSVRFYYGR